MVIASIEQFLDYERFDGRIQFHDVVLEGKTIEVGNAKFVREQYFGIRRVETWQVEFVVDYTKETIKFRMIHSNRTEECLSISHIVI